MAEIFTQTPWLFGIVSIYLHYKCTTGNRRDPSIRFSSHSRNDWVWFASDSVFRDRVPRGVAVEMGGDFSDFGEAVKLIRCLFFALRVLEINDATGRYLQAFQASA